MDDLKEYIKLERWKSRLEITDWDIQFVEIEKEQVVYDSNIPEEDRYCIGIIRDYNEKKALLFYDRPLKDDDYVHEFLHIKFSSWLEEDICRLTDRIIELYNSDKSQKEKEEIMYYIGIRTKP